VDIRLCLSQSAYIKAIKRHLKKLIIHHTGSLQCVKTHLLNYYREFRGPEVALNQLIEKVLESILLRHYDVVTKTSLEAVVDFLQQ
jgi:hypothetical protein